MGQDIRAWPMLAFLLAFIVGAIGCVLWFMREAIVNEQLAFRQKVSDLYQTQLQFLCSRVETRWVQDLARADRDLPAAQLFATAIREGWADGVIRFNREGGIEYPRGPLHSDGAGEALQSEFRRMVQAGQRDEAIQFAIDRFADQSLAATPDSNGRLVAASIELAALEIIEDRSDPRFARLIERLRARVDDGAPIGMPSAQRRFTMRVLLQIVPELEFPALPAEDLAAAYLEADQPPIKRGVLTRTALPDVWHAGSPGGQTALLFRTKTLRARFEAATSDFPLPDRLDLTVLAPGEIAASGDTLAAESAATPFPGWRFALVAQDPSALESGAERRALSYVALGSIVVAVLTVLGTVVARGFARQVRLAQLKNDLVATVSHELKTPLTAMRALVDTLLDSDRLDEETTRDYLKLVAQENARLSRLIDNFLTFSRLERNKFRFEFAELAPAEIAEHAIQALGERFHAPGCELLCETARDLPAIRGDRDALVTAVLNLLDNAWKYTGDEKRIRLRTTATNGSVQFAVEDNGIGLSAQDQRRVFRKFYQADQHLSRSAGGCGLGLGIVQSIAEAHGGRVHLSSEPGRGSTFTMELPVAHHSES